MAVIREFLYCVPLSVTIREGIPYLLTHWLRALAAVTAIVSGIGYISTNLEKQSITLIINLFPNAKLLE